VEPGATARTIHHLRPEHPMETTCNNTRATCEDCGERATFTGPCPFMEDVYNEIEIVSLCDKCWEQRADDV
jgi:hypothetical protein